jgi:hypothetical protein
LEGSWNQWDYKDSGGEEIRGNLGDSGGEKAEPEKEFDVIETIQAMLIHEYMLVEQHKREVHKLIEEFVEGIDVYLDAKEISDKHSDYWYLEREKWKRRVK